MASKRQARRSDCPINYALEILGDRWSLLIIRDMLFKQKSRYRQFAESEEKISTNILADRLGNLEAEGLVTRAEDPNDSRQVIYSLTPKGLDLAPMLVEMILWSSKYDPDSATDRSFVRKAKHDRERLLGEIRSVAGPRRS